MSARLPRRLLQGARSLARNMLPWHVNSLLRRRLFYLACSELFAYRGGEEWGVGHYRFTKKQLQ